MSGQRWIQTLHIQTCQITLFNWEGSLFWVVINAINLGKYKINNSVYSESYSSFLKIRAVYKLKNGTQIWKDFLLLVTFW